MNENITFNVICCNGHKVEAINLNTHVWRCPICNAVAREWSETNEIENETNQNE